MLNELNDIDNQVLKVLAKNIRKYREIKNLSQDRLALECDVAKSTIQRIEWGKLNPRITIVIRISKALDVAIGDLIIE